jgi:cytosine permease
VARPTHARESVLEDYERRQVPSDQGRSYLNLSFVFVGICVGIPPLLLGSALVAGMGLRGALLALVWSSVVATPICVLASHVGARSRLSTGMTLKFAFGTNGAKVIAAIIAVDLFCWAAINTEIFAASVQSTGASLWGASVAKPALLIFSGVLMTVVTIFGYRSVEKFAFLVVPLLTGVLAVYLGFSLAHTSVVQVMARPAFAKPIPFTTAISIVAGSYLNLSILLPDFTRYAKGVGHAAIAVVFGLCLGLPLFALVACYLTAATGQADIVKLMVMQGWGLAAIAVIAVTCWFHMNACVYSASLNLAAIIPRTAKWKLTVLAGLTGTALALFGIVGRYVPFLIILSAVVPPIAGVFTADYLLRRRIYQAANLEHLRRVRPVALLALAAGIAIAFMTGSRGEMGLSLFHLTAIPALDAFLASFLVQWVVGRLMVRRARGETDILTEMI